MKLINCEIQFEALFERTNDAVFILDLQGNHIMANRKACEIFGYTQEEMLSLSYMDLSAEVSESQKKMAVLLSGEHIDIYKRRFKHKDGTIIHCEVDIRLVRNKTGSPLYYQSVVKDITERVSSEFEMRYIRKLQELIMHLAINFVKTPIDALDAELNKILERIGEFCNVDRTYFFKYDYEARLMHNTHEWCAMGISSEIDQLQNVPFDLFPQWVSMHSEGKPYLIEEVERLDQGALKDILQDQGIKSLVTIPLMNGNDCYGFVGFDSVKNKKTWMQNELDLLELLASLVVNAEVKRMQECRLVQALKQAETASVSKSNFLANMSHEIRTPLNGIIGMLSLIKKTEITSAQGEFIEKADYFSKALLLTLNDILDYAKIERGLMKFDLKPFSITKLIEEVESIFRPNIIETGLTLDIQYLSIIPERIISDDFRIKQILLNLVSNAIKFTEIGTVSLEVDFEHKSEEGGNLILVIKDTGIGLTTEQIEVIFDPFVQADSSISRKYGGTGLGLTIVKEIIDQFEGKLSIKSTYNVGSNFYVAMPVKIEKPSTDHAFETLAYSKIKNTEDLKKSLQGLSIALEEQKPRVCAAYFKMIDGLLDDAEDIERFNVIKKSVKLFDFEKAREIFNLFSEQLENGYESD